jgi:hypothetical protein
LDSPFAPLEAHPKPNLIVVFVTVRHPEQLDESLRTSVVNAAEVGCGASFSLSLRERVGVRGVD